MDEDSELYFSLPFRMDCLLRKYLYRVAIKKLRPSLRFIFLIDNCVYIVNGRQFNKLQLKRCGLDCVPGWYSCLHVYEDIQSWWIIAQILC